MSSLWEQRAARNEALFREVNEQIAGLEASLGAASAAPGFICECPTDACTSQLTVDLETYRDVRENPRRFIVLPGHVDSELERVVEARPGYVIVEKTGIAGDVAEQLSD